MHSLVYYHPDVFGTVNAGYNMVHGANISNVGLMATDLQLDPLVVNANMDTFDGRLQAGSPAIDAGAPNGAPADDILGRLRDSLPDISAYEFGAAEGLTDLQKADLLFAWIESIISDWFPSGAQTQTAGSIYYRMYSTNVFLATYLGQLYFIDQEMNIIPLGAVDEWLPFAQGAN